MIPLRFYIVFTLATLFQGSNAQSYDAIFKDSLLNEIEVNKDTAFFEDLIKTIVEDGRLDKNSKLELINSATLRLKDLNYVLLKSKYDFIKSIQKTIEGDYTSAIQLLQPNLQIFEKHNSIYAAMSYNTMGNMVDRMGDKDLAIAYLTKAIELTQNSNLNKEQRAVQNSNNNLVLGNIYFAHDQMVEAEFYFNLANNLSYLDSTSVNKEKCFSLINLAKLELRKGNYRLCIEKNNSAILLAQIKNYPDIIAYANLRSGIAYTKMKQFDSALIHYNKAEAIT